MEQSDTETIKFRSGDVKSDDTLVCFLYLLMRDELATGVVEGIVKTVCSANEQCEFSFSNGWLASYAKDIATRLRHSFSDPRES